MYIFVLSFGAHILSLPRMAKENNYHQGLPQETGGRCGSFAKAKGGPTEFGVKTKTPREKATRKPKREVSKGQGREHQTRVRFTNLPFQTTVH